MQPRVRESLRKDLLRDSAKFIGKEPSELINTLTEDSGKAVMMLSPDYDMMWHSENIYDVTGRYGSYLGDGYCRYVPELRDFIKGLCTNGKRSSVLTQGIKEYEVVCYPLSKESEALGYIVTISEGIRAKLNRLLEKSNIRESNLCQITSTLLQPS